MEYLKSLALAAAATLFALGAQPALVWQPAYAQDASAPASATQLAVTKMNAYVKFMNDTLRATDSLQRYRLWVNMSKGPTGKERIIYGLYSLYDVGQQIDAVKKAAVSEPAMPDLDAAMMAYLDAYQKLAPVIEKANTYYERGDYKVDKMEGGKALHKDIAPLGAAYEARRKDAETALRVEKQKTDLAALAAIEKAEGKKAAWHVRNTMMHAETMINLLPDAENPVVDMQAFKAALDGYTAATTEFDDFSSANPGSFIGFESRPDTMLSEMRDFYVLLEKAKGDARKGAGESLEKIVSDYNLMVEMSETAVSDIAR
ncbi:YiiG family protein [Rhizobium tumorigenes]|uniref:YiiG family protein n=1 Tax=Rhizobium tumorigenes TaxID=2041385 RepID=A0AAF1KBI1_9HYPH|nr:YiiG family protein [Rhizobium tumorigenes]WFR99044.1 YiiG family protein [Rhizobium tumorigenes]